jgi:hypothetical protein
MNSREIRFLYLTHGVAGLANADFTFVIASQEEMGDAMGFSLE